MHSNRYPFQYPNFISILYVARLLCYPLSSKRVQLGQYPSERISAAVADFYGDAENGASGTDDTEAVDEEDKERAVARAAELQDRTWKTEERWRYDADVGVVVGGVVGLGDSEDGEEVRLIVDDYDSE
ncbi:hypothetical protein FRC02_005607 [Tulasnella sp. 418]|nr:hypothetical protein FRC02_005607 [Tulasnella sp. 418]